MPRARKLPLRRPSLPRGRPQSRRDRKEARTSKPVEREHVTPRPIKSRKIIIHNTRTSPKHLSEILTQVDVRSAHAPINHIRERLESLGRRRASPFPTLHQLNLVEVVNRPLERTLRHIARITPKKLQAIRIKLLHS